MAGERIHRATSKDGTTIAGRVVGDGPPVVLIHGGLGDGDVAWRALAPILGKRSACYLMSTRGRGLSADHEDHSGERMREDVVAFVESVGAPVGLVGHSSGGAIALDAAAHTASVSALALFEPTLFDLGPRDAVRDQDAFVRVGAAVEEGRLVDAARIFLADVALATEEELDFAEAGEIERLALSVPALLRDAAPSGPPRLGDPALLGRIAMPTLLLYGSRTPPFYQAVVKELAHRLDDAEVREVSGVAHLGPLTHPELVAREFARFFAADGRDGG